MPNTKTLVASKDDSINFDETEHIFIEGDNLDVLKVLQRSYFGKIRLAVIDPPYNTGGDSFVYPDKFSETKTEYLKRVGDKDEEGFVTKEGRFTKNSKENGQFHSNWLNMMYPRLFLARNLLSPDGLIFISIDDNEVHNLRLLMNEIFGEENFIGQLIWKRRQNVDSRAKKGISVDHEYVICYSKSEAGSLKGGDKDFNKYSNPDNDERGDWMSDNMVGLATKDQRPNLHYDLTDPETGITYKCPPTGWRYEPKRMAELIRNNEVLFPAKPNGRPRRKKFVKDLESDFTGFSSVLNTVFNTQGTRELRALFDDNEYFDFPKPTDLIKLLLKQGMEADSNQIVMDFFAGSGTTGQAVMELNKEDGGNRKMLLVQLPQPYDPDEEAYKAGYKSVAALTRERIRRSISKIHAEKENKIEALAALEALVYELNVELEKLSTEDPQANTLFEGGKESKAITKLKLEMQKKEAAIDALREEIENIEKVDLGFKSLVLSDSNFKQWQQLNTKDVNALEEQMKLFIDPVAETASIENMVYELLLKAGKDINSKVENKGKYYRVAGNELILMLEKATQDIVDAVLQEKPEKVIALDKLFIGNDQLKTNTVLQMKDAGVEFKTI
ncbi:site-specific DNA-methyltransferase [Pontibacter vulgaris]|uniref:site-specific DNA-methyltransferase n=1 Tax=Pontibacter vulgaris TaxID=2905679 RepID=UPI001FA6BB1F|nr:site-specific DNA-methyltransferase [Pontibacter vulgaris]